MSEMIERVARAIDPKTYEREAIAKRFVESAGNEWDGSWEQRMHKANIRAVEEQARAAIEAMRWPSKTMIAAGEWALAGSAYIDHDNAHIEKEAETSAYQSMIDAALKDD